MIQKILIFLGLLPDFDFPQKSKPELKQAAFLLYKKLKLKKHNLKFNTKSCITILLSKNYKLSRKETIQYLLLDPRFIFEGKGSSIGRLKYKNIIIYIKHLESQGNQAPGKFNEWLFLTKIKQYITGSLNINIISPSGSLKLENIINAEDTSNQNNHNYYKSDIQLITKTNPINISIKKEGGFIWESVIKRYSDIYNKFLFKAKTNQIPNLELVNDLVLENKYHMKNPQTGKIYGRVLVKGFPFYDDENIIFGNEKPKPIIVEKTFKETDFIYNNNVLTINVNNIYQTVKEIEIQNKLPMLCFSKNMGKPYGIELKCVPENKTFYGSKANVLELDYEFLMKD